MTMDEKQEMNEPVEIVELGKVSEETKGLSNQPAETHALPNFE
jgi:hypothetical protein